MEIPEIRSLIEHNRGSVAFIIGNGINRYSNNPAGSSWDQLLSRLWQEVTGGDPLHRPEGISTPEFYDILELNNRNKINLQERFCALMDEWEPRDHHLRIVETLLRWDVPLMTTNFENTLERAFRFELFHIRGAKSSDRYPWSSYYGNRLLEIPTDGFGIWHINGMVKYHRSIRLGLSHYMGSVEKARKLIHKGDDDSLFRGKNQNYWQGYNTWLHMIFNRSLFFFGLDLEENETFLRWLLIERCKYFQAFPDRSRLGWYLMKRSNGVKNIGKKFFLKGVGIEVIEVDSYDNIYRSIWE